jgi:hypothetical protein
MGLKWRQLLSITGCGQALAVGCSGPDWTRGSCGKVVRSGYETSQVETFFWAGRLGNFAKAAQQLHVTQSAVSMRIHELEAAIGIKLFDRTQRDAKLTSAGIELLPIAEQMLAVSDQILTFKDSHSKVVGYVRLGVVEIVAMTWLPALIERLRREFPLIQLHALAQKGYRGFGDVAVISERACKIVGCLTSRAAQCDCHGPSGKLGSAA